MRMVSSLPKNKQKSHVLSSRRDEERYMYRVQVARFCILVLDSRPSRQNPCAIRTELVHGLENWRFLLSRGQRHQRREKQLQLMDASEQIAQASVVSLLNDSSLQTERSRSGSPANEELSSDLHQGSIDEQSSEYGSASSSPIISSLNSVEDRDSNEKGSWRETSSLNGFCGSRLDMQSEDIDEEDQLRDAENCKSIPEKGSQDEVQCTVSVPLVSPFEELATAEDQGNVLAIQEILDDGQDSTPQGPSSLTSCKVSIMSFSANVKTAHRVIIK